MNATLPSIAEVVLNLPLDGPFDYFIDESLRGRLVLGMRVKILFNRKKYVGFVVGFKEKSVFKKLNPILSVLDGSPVFSVNTLFFLKKFAENYGCSLGEALATSLPEALRRGNSALTGVSQKNNSAPTQAQSILLQDLEGKEKWDVMLQAITQKVSNQEGVIILIPEISYLQDWEDKLKKAQVPFIAWGKKYTAQEQLKLWDSIFRGEISVVIGTRSAIFSPVQNLGLIIVTQEENEHYQQEQVPRYHASLAAQLRAAIEGCALIVESLTPRVVTWQAAVKEKWDIRQFVPKAKATMHVVDMSNYNPERSSIISFPLQNAIQNTLLQNGKVLIFLNQLGFTTITRCNQCAFTLKCPHCNTNLIYLYAKKTMVCRRCSKETDLPKICPQCNGNYLRSTGSGLEKIESELARLYPQVRTDHYEKETAVYPKDAGIVIATQAVLKKLNTIQADLVALIKFDAHLNRLDYKSSEEAFGLLLRLKHFSGSKIFVQTRMADHYCVTSVVKEDIKGFYAKELKFRREAKLPPFAHIVEITMRGKNEDAVFAYSQKLYEALTVEPLKSFEVFEPHPDAIMKLRDNFRFTIEVKGKSVKNILDFIKQTAKASKRPYGIITTLAVDP